MADPFTSEPASPKKSKFRNPLFYSSLILFCAGLYVVYVLYARYESNQRYQQQIKARRDAQRREDDLRAIEQLGGSELSIRGLYVSPSLIHTGQSAQLCYDVANAKTVTLDPPVASVWPSHSRCINVSPKRTTTYTLTIAGASGKTVSQSVELRVQ
jgi:hypothetical protein